MFIAIVPAFNEEVHIAFVVRALLDYVDEVVVVDDASCDRTASFAQEAGATVLSHEINRGQGAALQTGHEYALYKGATYVIHFDGHGQLDVLDIPEAKRVLDFCGVDIVLGSRFLGKDANIPFVKRYVLFPLGHVVNRFFAGMHLTDVHNGFRLFRGHVLDKLVITHDGMAHATEILALVKHHGFSYQEIPIHVTYHEYGQGARGGFRIVKDLIFGKFLS